MDPIANDAIVRLEKLGGPVFVGKMIRLFCDYVGEKVTEMSRASSAADFEALGRAAHAIKSSAANVGAVRVERLAVNIEEAVRAGKEAGVVDMVKDLQAAFDEVKPLLEERITRSSPGGGGDG